jgi:hypothetical protein
MYPIQIQFNFQYASERPSLCPYFSLKLNPSFVCLPLHSEGPDNLPGECLIGSPESLTASVHLKKIVKTSQKHCLRTLTRTLPFCLCIRELE